MRKAFFLLCLVLCLSLVSYRSKLSEAHSRREIRLEAIGTYAAGAFNQGAAEIVAHDPRTQRLFVVNGATSKIDVLSIDNPSAPSLLFSIDVSPWGRQANSVAVHERTVAAAVEANTKTDNGQAVFFDTDGNFLNAVEVGALPDMLTFTPDGRTVLVVNEAEPNTDYTIDPEGSVSIIDHRHRPERLTQDDVRTASFTSFNNDVLDPSIRIYGPGATVAQDLEPEYLTVSHDSKTAWVTLQENNAIGVLDIRDGEFTRLIGLGFKNHLLAGNALDGGDRDGPGNTPRINIANWRVFGMYEPDGIASFRHQGRTYLITANEGDAREYDAFAEERRVSALNLDPTAFPDAATLKTNAHLGRLTVTSANGDPDGDNDYDSLFALGGRSFSIWRTSGAQVFDSGDQFEQITAAAFPTFFNSSNDSNNSFDTRSDNKGPEPEGVVVGELFGRTYVFVGLERIGGIMVYEITNPHEPRFVQYLNNRNFSGEAAAGTAGDLGPEGLILIEARNSPIHNPLLVVANEVSGTTTIYKIERVDSEDH